MVATNRTNPLIWIGLAVAAIALLVAFYPYYNQLRKDTIRFETQISAQFLSNQNELGTYVSSFYEQVGIADRKSEQLDEIISSAVQGRYGEDGFSADGAFFSAVSEAYPDLDLSLYDDIASYVRAARIDYRDIQNKLLDQVRVYKNWLQDDVIRSFVLDAFVQAPTENLRAQVGSDIVIGEDALAIINTPIVPESVNEAYEDGVLEPLTVP